MATYNVHGHKGVDGRIRPERVLQVLRNIGADLFCLQEFVDQTATGGASRIDDWAEALAMQGCYAGSFRRRGEEFGHAILTRFTVLQSRVRDLTQPGHRRRIMLETILDTGFGTLQVMSVHLGVSPRERARQAARIIDILCNTRADAHVLMGDFNEWHRYGAIGRRLSRYFQSHHYAATFPAALPALGLDRIWVYPPGGSLQTAAHSAPPARMASDHLPLTARWQLPRRVQNSG